MKEAQNPLSLVIPSEAFLAERGTRGSPRAATFLIALALFLTTLSSAQTLTGTVKNGTTGKPSAGDDVVLLSLTQGMEESARSKIGRAHV